MGRRDSLLNRRPWLLHADFESIVNMLDGNDFPEWLVMEFLDGDMFGFDTMSWEDEPLAIVPKVRIQGNPSQTMYGQVRKYPDVEDVAAR